MLANSGENEFEEIFKIVLIKLWEDLHKENKICLLDDANNLLTLIDDKWPGILIEKKLNISEEQFCLSQYY